MIVNINQQCSCRHITATPWKENMMEGTAMKKESKHQNDLEYYKVGDVVI